MHRISSIAITLASLTTLAGLAHAAPYASGISVSGTSVSFTLNEPADVLAVQINGGAFQLLDGSSKGTKAFTLGAPGDTFSITVRKNDSVGYTIPTGGSVAAATNGLSQATNASGFNLISLDTNPLVRFNSPRGVAVSNNPNAPNFGTTYISNSAAGNTSGVVRAVGDGLYALKADQSDAYGYGNTASDPGNLFDSVSASASSPFRLSVAANGDIYAADFSDAQGNVYRNNPNMTVGSVMLSGIGGPSAIPAGQYHGSTTAVYVEGSAATGDLVLYTLDEDLTTLAATGAGSNTDKNSLWRYAIGSGVTPFTGAPTKVNATNPLVALATSDMDRGLVDGKFYLAQNRSGGAEAGITVLNSDGTVAFDSLSATRALLGNPTANDIFRNVLAMDVSDNQQWMAVLLNNSDVAVIPMVGGIPDIAQRMIVDTGADVNSGRDIAFDAVGNIHYVSSGQALYRVLSPGGSTQWVTSYDGTQFSLVVPEPATLAALGLIAPMALRRRK